MPRRRCSSRRASRMPRRPWRAGTRTLPWMNSSVASRSTAMKRGSWPCGAKLPNEAQHAPGNFALGLSLFKEEAFHDLRDRGAVYQHQGHGLRRGVPDRLHPSEEGRAGFRERDQALHRPRDLHRLWRVRAGVPSPGDLPEGRAEAGMGAFRSDGSGLVREEEGLDALRNRPPHRRKWCWTRIRTETGTPRSVAGLKRQRSAAASRAPSRTAPADSTIAALITSPVSLTHHSTVEVPSRPRSRAVSG